MTTAPAAQGSDVTVDYSGFAGMYGGDWAQRLRIVSIPACAATTPGKAACRTQTPLATTNNSMDQTLTAKTASTGGLLALTAGASSGAGDWKATSLRPSGAWSVSGATGDFDWSYPMRVPPAPGQLAPNLNLSYSSAQLDGEVSDTNNQTSWVGDGWDLGANYVERKYVACSDDMAGGNNATHKTGDLCWKSDNATLVFEGKALDLIKDKTTGAWHAVDDDTTRIEHLTGGSNAAQNGEYWRVTTEDGTQYYFGRGKRPSDGKVLNSTWTVPVYGNQSGEPCYQSDFASSVCTQGWRWNLDYVVDTSGNSATYNYQAETNHYGRNMGQAVSSYVRGGYLTSIEYGTRSGSESGNAPERVDFTVAERCLPTSTESCDPSDLKATTASHWPDVPFDLICTSTTSCPNQYSPAFFTRKMLANVTTKVLSGSSYRDVDSWTLGHQFPDPGDATDRSLWLSSVQQTGKASSTAVTLPKVTFIGQQMGNRVDKIGDLGPAMNHYRLTAINSEYGATTSINYSPIDCTPDSLPASPQDNTRRCFPVWWTPEGFTSPVMEYFHKYVVTSVVENGGDVNSVPTTTAYSYSGTPAWRYVNSDLIPAGQRTWSDWRGYSQVTTTVGDATTSQLKSTVRYFRGMDGDRLSPTGGTRSVSVDGITDHDRFNGMERESITYNGTAEVSGTLNTPWLSAPTATAADGTSAYRAAIGTTETRTTAPARPGGEVTTRTVTTYDSYGLPQTVDDQGDITTSSDDRCARTTYARNTAANILTTVARVETVAVSCATTPSRPRDVISDDRTLYDGGTYGQAPTKGLVTGNEEVSTYSGTTPVYVRDTTTTYDADGRPATVTDALGRTTTTSYTPTTGPVTKVTTTTPDPDKTGPATAMTSTVTYDPAWGTPTATTDENGETTTGKLDGLGRLVAVWNPGRDTSASANTTYTYSSSPAAITTKQLTANGGYTTSISIMDGLLREVQTQSQSMDTSTPGRMITDKIYDSRGLEVQDNDKWYTSGDPSTTQVTPLTAVPSRTITTYDGAGRKTATVQQIGEQDKTTYDEKWRTTTTYGGDRVTVSPPTGAVPTTTITDARGNTTELRQYTTASVTGPYRATTYTYDTADRLKTATDAAGNVWTNTYDLRGRKIQSTDPDKGTTTTTYDDADQPVTTKDALGNVLYTVYDQLGRKTELHEDSATGPLRAKWTYDTVAKGQLASSTRYDNGNAYTTAIGGYAPDYQPTEESVTLPASEGALAGTYSTKYTYKPNGQLDTYTNSAAGPIDAETVYMAYDDLSNPAYMVGDVGWGSYVVAAKYTAYGETEGFDLGGNNVQLVDYGYEYGTRRLSNMTVAVEGDTGNDLDQSYAYDPSGQITSITSKAQGLATDTQCFAYADLDQLTDAWTPSSNDCTTAKSAKTLGGPAPYWTSYTYDNVGNRTSTTSHAATGDTTSTYTYPAAKTAQPHAVQTVTTTAPSGVKQVSTYAYDADGNMTTRAPAASTAQTLTWDPEGDLATVSQGGKTTGSYLYDADGNRLIRRQDGTTTAYLPGGQEITMSATGSVTANRYYTFNGQVVAMRTGVGSANNNTLVTDPHGTATLSINKSTSTVTRRYTDPFGNPRGTAPSTWPGDHTFLNQPQDTTGLIADGDRYYDPTIGKFASVDPVMDLTDPTQWNAYTYANNNPIRNTDPTGDRPLGPDDGPFDHYNPTDYGPHATSHTSWTPPAPPHTGTPSTNRRATTRRYAGTAIHTRTGNTDHTAEHAAPKPPRKPQHQTWWHKASHWIGQSAHNVGNWFYQNRREIGSLAIGIAGLVAMSACAAATAGICAGLGGVAVTALIGGGSGGLAYYVGTKPKDRTNRGLNWAVASGAILGAGGTALDTLRGIGEIEPPRRISDPWFSKSQSTGRHTAPVRKSWAFGTQWQR